MDLLERASLLDELSGVLAATGTAAVSSLVAVRPASASRRWSSGSPSGIRRRGPVPVRGLRPAAHAPGARPAARPRPPDGRPAGGCWPTGEPREAVLRGAPRRARAAVAAAGGRGRGRPLGRRGDAGPADVPRATDGAHPGAADRHLPRRRAGPTIRCVASSAGCRQDTVRRLALEPLSEAAVAELARRAGRPGTGLHALTGGNPLLVTEVLAAGDAGVPLTVRDLVLARFGGLPADAAGGGPAGRRGTDPGRAVAAGGGAGAAAVGGGRGRGGRAAGAGRR